MLCNLSLKNKVFLILVVVVLCTFSWTNISTALSLKKTDFYCDGLPWITLHFCVYMIWGYETLLLKRNGEMLMQWLSEQFWRCCSCVYVLIDTSRALQCVWAKGKRASLTSIHNEIWSRNNAALLQTATSILTLHRPFLSARYLSRLCFSGEHERWQQNDRAEHHAAQWWRLRESGNMNTAGWCGAA